METRSQDDRQIKILAIGREPLSPQAALAGLLRFSDHAGSFRRVAERELKGQSVGRISRLLILYVSTNEFRAEMTVYFPRIEPIGRCPEAVAFTLLRIDRITHLSELPHVFPDGCSREAEPCGHIASGDVLPAVSQEA